MTPEDVKRWLKENDFGEIVSSRPVGGGSISSSQRLETETGEVFFLKTNRQTPPDFFAREAEGLQALRVEDGPTVPKPYLHGEDFILMEDLGSASRKVDYWTEFGRKMAALHDHTHDQFGFAHDNYIGSTPQPNRWTEDGWKFFAEQRLMYQANLARKRGLLERGEARQVENLAQRLPELVPQQSASLVHGDLWSGNAVTDAQGGPAIIDPAAHYGWAEADLAMTALFGAFGEAFYRAYEETRHLEKGYRQRFPLYNLYHLLNHLNLFGSSYYGQVISVLRRYS